MNCTLCNTTIPPGSTQCPACGTNFTISNDVTVTDTTPRQRPAPPSDSSAKRNPTSISHSFSRIGYEGHYIAGTTLADRYRIVALLGKGGMGEVYRAEDLRLTQAVALKFLPDAMLRDEAARARFHQEVRLAREISHPNICRVFDIGEVDGRLFLTMEYIDGEDLASLLRRIGQLPQSKGLDIARQMCAGLAAAHDHGVLHRDLKPGNIMLDGRGRVRITDFGLAALGENLAGEELRAGTPAYMAPEQLAGTEVTARSDIYSLGLVLYEIFTGKKAFEAATLADLVRLREHSSPTSISTIVRDIDPLVERVILRCLEKDPARRPATALQVAAALPGGDPLAAALAAGETPSPEMVAAAGETEGLRPAFAWICLVLAIIGLGAAAFLAESATIIGIVPLPSSPDVLAAKAREIMRQIGYSATPLDASYGIRPGWSGYIDYVEKHDQSATRWKNLSTGSPPVMAFWYRESPRYFEVDAFTFTPIASPDRPPNDVSGDCQVFLDSLGRLIQFECVPPQFVESTAQPTPPNWGTLFAAAGMDMKAFRETAPQWTELVEADVRTAWEGHWPDHADIPLRVEAGAFRGVPVYFQTHSPWDKPTRMQEETPRASDTAQNVVELTIFFAVVAFAVVLAARNLRANRGDRSGAFRLALGVFCAVSVMALLFAHNVPTIHELLIFLIAVGWGLIYAALVWLIYIAIEPHVRRRWPHVLISWSRLLAGQFRDALVGRDLLIGIVMAVFLDVNARAAELAPQWMGPTPAAPSRALDLVQFNGLRIILADFGLNFTLFVFIAFAVFFAFFLVRLLVRREWLAGLIISLLFAIPNLFSAYPVLNSIAALIAWGVIFLVLIRFGFLPLVVGMTLDNVLEAFPLTRHFSAWYAEPTIFVFSVLIAVAILSFYTSLGGKSAFGNLSLDN
jgi:predicted Ser/Thr protein kinase